MARAWARSRPGVRRFIQVFHVGGKDSRLRASCRYLLRCISRDLGGRQNSQDLNWGSMWNASFAGGSLTCCATIIGILTSGLCTGVSSLFKFIFKATLTQYHPIILLASLFLLLIAMLLFPFCLYCCFNYFQINLSVWMDWMVKFMKSQSFSYF